MYITQLVHRHKQQRPNKVAVIDQGREYTFSEFADRIAHLAGAFQQLGVDDGDRIGILSLNSVRYLEYTFAVPWAGCVLNPVNIRWSATEVAYSLDDSDTKVLLVDDAFVPLVDDIKAKSKSLKTLIYTGRGATPEGMLNYDQLVDSAIPIEDKVRRGDDLLGVFYTGGTTGFPKGVMITHNSVMASSMAFIAEGLSPYGTRMMDVAPLFHVAGWSVMLTSMIRGNMQIVVPMFEPGAVLAVIEQYKVNSTILVPTMVQMLLDHPDVEKTDLSSLQQLLYGASPMPQKTVELAIKVLPQTQIVQAYGMTETSPLISFSGPENHTLEGIASGRIRSAGRSGMLQEIRVVNAEGENVPVGTVGEVLIRGCNVMAGYWGKPDVTAETIVDGWMHTGDGGYLDDEGYLFIVDRVKDMVISGGENIYSVEVENAVMAHPSVARCAVIGIPSEEWGEEVHAVIVAAPSQTPELAEIKNYCKEFIAGYKCPRSISVVEALPLSGAGKVLKNELRRPYWEGQASQVG